MLNLGRQDIRSGERKGYPRDSDSAAKKLVNAKTGANKIIVAKSYCQRFEFSAYVVS